MAPARLLLQTHAGGEGGVASGLPFSGGMTRDHAVTPGVMETKLFSILLLHMGKKEKVQESWAEIQLTPAFAGTIMKCKYCGHFLTKQIYPFIKHLFKEKILLYFFLFPLPCSMMLMQVVHQIPHCITMPK